MCDKCQPHSRYWLHIADAWTKEEKAEMLEYLVGYWKAKWEARQYWYQKDAEFEERAKRKVK